MTTNDLFNILINDKPSESLRKNEQEVFRLLPELKICKGFQQNNPWHPYDVYEHILRVVDGVPDNLYLRTAALFHDIGKPAKYYEDENGIGHFPGHWDESNEIFKILGDLIPLEEEKDTNKSNNEKSTIVKSQISNPVLTHSFASPSLATQVIYQKYIFYRLSH